jgi:uridine phosphorylase
VCSSIGRPARTSSIAARMKEEEQIMVMIEFGVERGRTWVEGERIRVGEVLVCFHWVGCPQ